MLLVVLRIMLIFILVLGGNKEIFPANVKKREKVMAPPFQKLIIVQWFQRTWSMNLFCFTSCTDSRNHQKIRFLFYNLILLNFDFLKLWHNRSGTQFPERSIHFWHSCKLVNLEATPQTNDEDQKEHTAHTFSP